MRRISVQLKSVLGDRYAIRHQIGRGGMAVVYLADDLKHNRPVAIKVLRPEIAAVLGADRFFREIELVSSLTHPHILPLHDSGDAGGMLYFVMPAVDGGALRDRLLREGRLPMDEAIGIVREIGAALDYAHRKQVLHRDVKPENILFQDGAAMLTDFGMGRALDEPGDDRITDSGVALGTTGYMSPEQAAGDPDLDGRCDQYALGCVLYEALTGREPFEGESPLRRLAKRLSQDPVPVTALREEIPDALALALNKAMARNRADRFATCAEFADALSLIDLSRDARSAVRRPAEVPPRSVAVLPFKNVSADPDNDYFGDGMTEEIIGALTQLDDLKVASRTSSFAFRDQPLAVGDIAERLGVATVLEGSVRIAGDQLRIHAQLVDAATDTNLWNERYDRRMDDVFAVQDEIATAIADRLHVALAGRAAEGLVSPATENLDAYYLYLRGRHFWNKRGAFLAQALACFEQACAADPDFALAHAGLADAYSMLGVWGYVPAALVHAKVPEAANRVLALDESLAEGHFSMGIYKYYFEHDLAGAERHLRRAMGLNPRDSMPVAFLAQMLGLMGRCDEAVTLAAAAQQRDPLSPLVQVAVSFAYTASARGDRGVEAARRALAVDDTFALAHFSGGWTLADAGRVSEGIQWMERALVGQPPSPFQIAVLATWYVESGQDEKAEPLIAEIERGADAGQVDELFLALAAFARQRDDDAFELLRVALEKGQPLAWATGTFPPFRWLYGDDRWLGLLRERGLDGAMEANRLRFEAVPRHA